MNPLGHWLQITFGTRLRILLRALSGFWVPPGLVVLSDTIINSGSSPGTIEPKLMIEIGALYILADSFL